MTLLHKKLGWFERNQKLFWSIVAVIFILIMSNISVERHSCEKICASKNGQSFQYIPNGRYSSESKCYCYSGGDIENKVEIDDEFRFLW